VRTSTDPNENVTTYDYDPRGNLETIDHPGTELGSETMTYDDLSRLDTPTPTARPISPTTTTTAAIASP
jgi:YD repeat-containing protein